MRYLVMDLKQRLINYEGSQEYQMTRGYFCKHPA